VPLIGNVDLASVRPSDVRDVVLFYRKANKLAPRTIRHVFATMAIMFGDAIADELITTTPCVLRKGVLPKKVDKDPDWRATAIYDRSEIGLLMFDTRVLQDRRVLYALKALAGLRHGEAARLRWSHFNEDLEPLTALNLGRTKTGVPRSIPVHPTLHAVLTEWKEAGWERIFGRPPTDDDLIVPTRNLTMRESPEAQKALHDDLALLELRPRRGHDLRRTFITLAQVDGARKDILEAISHGPRGDIVSVYTTFPWPVLCAEVAKLKIEPAVVRIPRGLVDKARYTAVTGEQSSRNRWTKSATPAGFETVQSSAKHNEVSRSPTENPKAAPTSRRLVRGDSSKVAKLALLASNAVKNLDLSRAQELLGELLRITGTPPLEDVSVRAAKP